MKLYIKSSSDARYLYIFKHGIGPGTIPSDVQIAKTKDLPNGYTAVWLDRFLTADELKQYDIPSETRINELLGRIDYCQKNGDVVPCDGVEASTEITSDSHIWESEDFAWQDYGSSESYGGFESPKAFENWYYGISPDDKYFTIQLYLKDGSEHWCEKLEPSPEDAIYSLYPNKKINLIKSDASDYDYAVWSGRMCDGQKCNPADALYFKKVSDDVDACNKVQASSDYYADMYNSTDFKDEYEEPDIDKVDKWTSVDWAYFLADSDYDFESLVHDFENLRGSDVLVDYENYLKEQGVYDEFCKFIKYSEDEDEG